MWYCYLTVPANRVSTIRWTVGTPDSRRLVFTSSRNGRYPAPKWHVTLTLQQTIRRVRLRINCR